MRPMDPRTKLFLLLLANMLMFLHADTLTHALMMDLFLLPFFTLGRARTGLKFLIIYCVMFAADYLLMPHVTGRLQTLVGILTVGFRMMLPCIATGALAFATTTPGELFLALRKLRLPEGLIITCQVVIRFFPTVLEDYRHIRNAMALRGIAVGPAHPVKSLEYVIIPLLMNGTSVANDLAVASLTKGIGLTGEHTSMTQIRLRGADWGYMALCAVPVLLFAGGIL